MPRPILDKLREKIGLDVCKDLHGVTAYGMEPGKHTGVLIVHAKVDQKLLLQKAEKAPDHKVTKFESYPTCTVGPTDTPGPARFGAPSTNPIGWYSPAAWTS